MRRSEQVFAELQGEKRIAPYEKEYLNAGNSRFWDLFAAPKINDKESAEYVIDTTARKRAEAESRESEEQSNLIFKSVEDYAIITTDTNGVVNNLNRDAEKIFG